MEGIARIFDYMKDAFHVNKENRGLYKPQIVLILMKATFFIITGLMLYKVMIFAGDNSFRDINPWEFVQGIVFWIGLIILLLSIAELIVEAGLYNMYKSCIVTGTLAEGSFFEGVRKYFIRFLLANLLMIAAWLVLLIPFIFIGIVTLLIGFILVPLLFTIFTAMWKVDIVMNDSRVMEGLRNSISFARKQFLPLSVLIMIQSAFTQLLGGKSGGSSSSNFSSAKNHLKPMGNNISFGYLYREILPYLKMAFYILLPVISVAVIVSSLIRMVFQVFFSLCIFIMYSENQEEGLVGDGGTEYVVR
ncbi:hypothetical protein JR334_05830 [Clostridia bacterium]|nr:hypothetical protein JR334_05830 [Clostridia bacterium]